MENIDPTVVESWIVGSDDDVVRVFSSPKAGSVWYIVSMKWLNKWRSLSHLKVDEMEIDEETDPESSNMDIDKSPSAVNGELAPPPSIPLISEVANPGLTFEHANDNEISSELPSINKSEDFETLGPVDSTDILDINPNYVPSLIIHPEKRLAIDYEILPPKAWDYFKQKFGATHEIERFSIPLLRNETKVEIFLKKVNIVYYYGQIINNDPVIFHVSLKATKSDLEELIEKESRSRVQNLPDKIKLFLWKCEQGISLSKLEKLLSSTEKIFPGKMLSANDEIQNLEIADEDYVVCELVNNHENTSFKVIKKPSLINSLSGNSRRGLTGLQNLGNTCFMNSGLQCLSNTQALTEYILSNKYKSEINSRNRIGSGGRIISAYAELIREMWTGSSSSVSPWNLKKALGGFASQFIGYSQQDSQEMLSYLIDGIHEDLNQALKPPPTDIDERGLSEAELAAKWWEKHKERNKSIIVDIMHGQYKSVVTCLECRKPSEAFDPFLMLTLPVPTKETMMKEVTVIKQNRATICKFEVPYQCKVRDLLNKIPADLKCENSVIGECEGTGKEIRKLITKSDIVDKHREYVVFFYEDLEVNQTVVVCNFSIKTVNDHYGCGNPLGLSRLFIVRKETLKDFHLELYSKIIQTIEEKELLAEEVEQRFHLAFPAYFSDKPDVLYNLSAFNPGRAPCVVCQKETCYGCKIPYKEDPLQNYLDRNRDPCLFLNLIAIGDKSRFASRLGPLKYEKGTQYFENSRNSNENRGINIYDCIKLSEEVEELDEQNTIYCKTCKKHVKATKQMNVYKLPSYLIIHLKRFKRHGYGSQKNGATIDFPVTGLLMKNHCGETFSYDLYAVSNHYGSMGGGHYTAYGKNIDGNWYDFNDSSVSKVRDIGQLASSAAYVLFYKRSNLD